MSYVLYPVTSGTIGCGYLSCKAWFSKMGSEIMPIFALSSQFVGYLYKVKPDSTPLVTVIDHLNFYCRSLQSLRTFINVVQSRYESVV